MAKTTGAKGASAKKAAKPINKEPRKPKAPATVRRTGKAPTKPIAAPKKVATPKVPGKVSNAGRKPAIGLEMRIAGEIFTTWVEWWAKIDELLALRYEGTSIADMLGVHVDTFYNMGVAHGKWGDPDQTKIKKRAGDVEPEYANFSAYKAAKRARGVENIIAAQMQTAMGIYKSGKWELFPNATMLIWAGKQFAQQKDQTDIVSDGKALPAPTTTVLNIVRRKSKD